MALLSKGLLEVLEKAGMCVDAEGFAREGSLAEWFEAQGMAVPQGLLEAYFGVPYRALERDAVLQAVTLSEHDGWALYHHVKAQCYVCVRPPSAEEKAAFYVQYGEATLYITDEAAVHAVLLRGSLPSKQVGQGLYRVYDVREMLRQGVSHVDGMIGMIVRDALQCEATDVHCYSLQEVFHIDFRIHGALKSYVALPQCAEEPFLNKLKLMAEMDIAEHRLPQDGHIAMVLDDTTVHLRLGTLPLLAGEKMVVRLLPEKNRHANLEILGFESAQKKALLTLLERGQGLLLLTGPTNSGKTTTLYACLEKLAKAGKLVYTIEDPVEAIVAGVQQSQVNLRGGYSFAQGLRGILRSDPDVIAVGELRDSETVDIAARAALSGHLVLATLHAANAHQAVNRLRDLGLSDLMISAVLLGVVNQRLVPQACDVCGGAGVDVKGGCCTTCLGSGIIGRRGVQELWIPTEIERANIERGINSVTLRQEAIRDGFRTFSRVAQEKDAVIFEGEGRP